MKNNTRPHQIARQGQKQLALGVFEVRESHATRTVSVNRLLADGSSLTSSWNAHLLATIDMIVQGEKPLQPKSDIQEGTAIEGILGAFSVLVQWMKFRKIHYFGHLTDDDFKQYVVDSSKGLDQTLGATPRLTETLRAIAADPEQANCPWTLSRLFEQANISPSLKSKLPKCVHIANYYLKTGKVCPPPQITEKPLARSSLYPISLYTTPCCLKLA